VDEAADEEVEEAEEEAKEATAKTAGEEMREYVEKVSASMGDNGDNTKSPHASPNKMGDGTTANIVKGGEEKGGDHAGLGDMNAKEDNAGNRNTPGGMSAKKGTKNEPGHGAEKKGKPENAADKKSMIGS